MTADARLFVTSDIWLACREEKVLAGNVRTGRRALLNKAEMVVLDALSEEADRSRNEAMIRRFQEADLVLDREQEKIVSPRLASIEKAVDRFLVRALELRKSTLQQRFERVEDKLTEAHRLLTIQIEQSTQRGVHSSAVVKRDLEALFHHVLTFVDEESRPEPKFRFRPGFLLNTIGRPLPREDYEQQPCMPETSQRRVELAISLLQPDSRGLFLGDDDLLSLYWNGTLPNRCDVLELDGALLEFLIPKLDSSARVLARDLRKGLPREFCGIYHLVFADPMYEREGMDLFMGCCHDALSPDPASRVLFTTRCDMIDDGHLFKERLASAGLLVERRMENFSRYRLPDFYRRKLVAGFSSSGLSAQLIEGLVQIPYLYADMFLLRKRLGAESSTQPRKP